MQAPSLVTLLAESPDPTPAQDQLNLSVLAALVALAIPLLVNLLAKKTASDGLKAILNIVGVSLVSVTALWTNPTGASINFWTCVNVFLASLAASFVAYKGAYKPLGIAGAIAEKTSAFGIGSPPVMELSDQGAEEVDAVAPSDTYAVIPEEYDRVGKSPLDYRMDDVRGERLPQDTDNSARPEDGEQSMSQDPSVEILDDPEIEEGR
jgi:hypothetical protein